MSSAVTRFDLRPFGRAKRCVEVERVSGLKAAPRAPGMFSTGFSGFNQGRIEDEEEGRGRARTMMQCNGLL
jgi:hypothetical protein